MTHQGRQRILELGPLLSPPHIGKMDSRPKRTRVGVFVYQPLVYLYSHRLDPRTTHPCLPHFDSEVRIQGVCFDFESDLELYYIHS
jgi:hypothetical protein